MRILSIHIHHYRTSSEIKHNLSMSTNTRAMHQLHARVSATTQRPTASINLGLTYEIGIVEPKATGRLTMPSIGSS